MKEKLNNDKFAKDLLFKFITVLIIASAALLLLNVLSQNKDGRMQIIDEDGGTEYSQMTAITLEEARLAKILSDIKGVGSVGVMLSYTEPEEIQSVFSNIGEAKMKKIKGVIVTAQGAENPVIKNNIKNAVSAVYDIPLKNVIIFEKNGEENQ